MKQRATAIAIATIMVAAGLSVAPPAAALEADCNEDFEIADSESLAQKRSLDPGEKMVGHEEVLADNPETLNVRLETQNDELTWQVFLDDGGCNDYTAGGCNGENVIATKGTTQSCTLNDPNSGTRDYYIVYKNTETDGDPLKFSTWVS